MGKKQKTKKEIMLEAHRLLENYDWKSAEKLVLILAKNGDAEAQYIMSEVRNIEMIELKVAKVRVKKAVDGGFVFRSSKKTQKRVDSLDNQSRSWLFKASIHNWLLSKNTSDEDSLRAQYIASLNNAHTEAPGINSLEGSMPFTIARKMEIMRKAAEKNIFDAQLMYSLALRNDSLESFKWLKLAADNNNSQALYYLAGMYASGKMVKKDIDKAINYYSKSLDAGDGAAGLVLGGLYYDGKEVERDVEKAIYYYDKSYQKFLKRRFSQYINYPLLHLGDIYTEKKEYKKALGYYQLVGEHSGEIGEARYRMGEIYATLEQYNKAIYWLQKSDYKDASRKLREIRNR